MQPNTGLRSVISEHRKMWKGKTNGRFILTYKG